MAQAGGKSSPHPEHFQTEQLSQPFSWKLKDAKAKFSKMVRRAQSEGPQRVSIRGRDAVVVVADELYGIHPHIAGRLPFVTFMETLSGEGLDLTRDGDNVRNLRASGAALFDPWEDDSAGSPVLLRRKCRRFSIAP